MDNELTLEELNNVSASDTETTPETQSDVSTEETLQTNNNPLEQELERLRPKRTHEEKLEYNIKRMQKELDERRGVQEIPDGDQDDEPFTIGMWKKMQEETAIKTATQLADSITDTTERELVRFHIDNTIRPSGDPQEDLKRARALANSVRNQQVTEMQTNKVAPQTHSGSSGSPAKSPIQQIQYSATEMALKQAGLLNDEEIMVARKTIPQQ